MKAPTYKARTHVITFSTNPKERGEQYGMYEALGFSGFRDNSWFNPVWWPWDDEAKWNHSRACLEHAAKLGMTWQLDVVNNGWYAHEYAQKVWERAHRFVPTVGWLDDEGNFAEMSGDDVRRIFLSDLVNWKPGAWKAMKKDLALILDLTKGLKNITIGTWNGPEGPLWPHHSWAIESTWRRRLMMRIVEWYVRWKSPHPVLGGTVRHIYAPDPPHHLNPDGWKYDTKRRLTNDPKVHVTELGASALFKSGTPIEPKRQARMFYWALDRTLGTACVILNVPLAPHSFGETWPHGTRALYTLIGIEFLAKQSGKPLNRMDSILLWNPECMKVWKRFVGLEEETDENG